MWRLAELLLIFSSGVFIYKMTHKDLKKDQKIQQKWQQIS